MSQLQNHRDRDRVMGLLVFYLLEIARFARSLWRDCELLALGCRKKSCLSGSFSLALFGALGHNNSRKVAERDSAGFDSRRSQRGAAVGSKGEDVQVCLETQSSRSSVFGASTPAGWSGTKGTAFVFVVETPRGEVEPSVRSEPSPWRFAAGWSLVEGTWFAAYGNSSRRTQ